MQVMDKLKFSPDDDAWEEFNGPLKFIECIYEGPWISEQISSNSWTCLGIGLIHLFDKVRVDSFFLKPPFLLNRT